MRVAIRSLHDLVRDPVQLALDLVELASHEPLHRKNCVGRVRDCLPLGGLADHSFSRLRKCHDRRSGACTLRILQNDWLAALHDRHAGVGGAEVDA